MSVPSRRRFFALSSGLLLAACGTPSPRTVGAHWQGRLNVRVESQPPKTFSAGFTLRGSPQYGTLLLSSPLGTTEAAVSWQPGDATLQRSGTVRRYRSMDELTLNLLGAAVPMPALFAWLRGLPSAAAGWQADLRSYGNGRIVARRFSPTPTATLTVLLQ